MSEENGKVVRKIKAKTAKTPAKAKDEKIPKTAKKTGKVAKKHPKNPKVGYFKGAWQELRQVHWPNRRSTWKLTFAVLLFSGFFVLLVLLADWGFSQLVRLMIF